MADVAVIGAGGAGLLAGIAAGRAGARAVLYERMKAPAKKVAISGGGRCNFSNALEPRQFIKLFGDPNATLLGHSLRAFSRDDLVALLARHGVEGQVERCYRLYTKSGHGADVVNALVVELHKAGCRLLTGARVTAVERRSSGYLLQVDLPEGRETHRARAVVVATGGLSYPQTGSTGDGYDWARRFGHRVTDLRAALVGLTVEEEWPRKLSGVAWPDARATLWPPPAPEGAPPPDGPARPLADERAEVLFTHFGISGPAILDVSNVFVGKGLTRASLRLDLFPDVPAEELDGRLIALLKRFPARSPARALEGLLPARLLDALARLATGGAEVQAGNLSREMRRALLASLKGTALTVTGTRGIEYGEVTAGGVAWDEIDPSTLESRLSPGLFFAGEILDLTGRCGGFNLQAAFSTGYLAGHLAAQRSLEVTGNRPDGDDCFKPRVGNG